MSIEKITLLPGKILTCTATGSNADFLLYAPTTDGDYSLVSALTAGQSATVGPFGSSKVYAANSTAPVSFVIADADPVTAATAASTAAGESLSELTDDGLADGVDIALGTSTGTKIGTAANQKLAVHGATPTVQRASANQAAITPTSAITGSDTVDAAAVLTAIQNLETLGNEIRAALVEKGWIKGSA